MPQTLRQSVTLPASAERLFAMYLDPVQHAAMTGQAQSGQTVNIAAQAGAEFEAFGGMLRGRILQIVAPRLVVQAWRSAKWAEEEVDSTLVLSFWPAGTEGRIELVHVNVADDDAADVDEGWRKHYWTPWREYLLSHPGQQ